MNENISEKKEFITHLMKISGVSYEYANATYYSYKVIKYPKKVAEYHFNRYLKSTKKP